MSQDVKKWRNMQSSQAALPLEKSWLCSGFGALALSSKGPRLINEPPTGRGRGAAPEPAAPLPEGPGELRARCPPRQILSRGRGPCATSPSGPSRPVGSVMFCNGIQRRWQRGDGQAAGAASPSSADAWLPGIAHTLSQICRWVHIIPALPNPRLQRELPSLLASVCLSVKWVCCSGGPALAQGGGALTVTPSCPCKAFLCYEGGLQC